MLNRQQSGFCRQNFNFVQYNGSITTALKILRSRFLGDQGLQQDVQMFAFSFLDPKLTVLTDPPENAGCAIQETRSLQQDVQMYYTFKLDPKVAGLKDLDN